jgi:hypothetical protein
MSKLIIIFVILLAVGGVVFYFGWVQIQLPENTYAVIFTKTGGWDEEVTEPGKFSWRWERLIPTNCTIHKFTLKTHTTGIEASGTLPSGDIYSGILDPSPDFGFSVDMTVSFGLKPESLPALVSDASLSQDTFEVWYTETKTAIASKSGSFIRERAMDVNSAISLTSMADSFIRDLTRYLERSFPVVDFKAVFVDNIDVPDFDLYLTAKELFLEYSESRKESYEAALSRITWTESRAEQHFNILEKYGELISRYPTLLDLFSLKEGDLGKLLEEIDAYTVPEELP